MKSKIIALGLCVLAIVACDSNKQPPFQRPATLKHSIDANTTDDQKFSYMIGVQFGGPCFRDIAKQIGEYFELDYLVQGIRDNFKALKDSTFELSISNDSMKSVDAHYADVLHARAKLAHPDSATEMSFEGDFKKLQAYVDSAIQTLPVAPAAAFKDVEVKLDENSTVLQKYSYIMGVQLHRMFHGVELQFGTEFDVEYFVLGAEEASIQVLDSTYALQLPVDSLKAVNDRYVAKIRAINQERMSIKEAPAEPAKADSAAPAAPATK